MKHSGWGLQGGSQPPQAGSSRPAGKQCLLPRCQWALRCHAVQRQPEKDHHITCKHELGHQPAGHRGLCNEDFSCARLPRRGLRGQQPAGRGLAAPAWPASAIAGLEHQLVGRLNHRLEGLQGWGGRAGGGGWIKQGRQGRAGVACTAVGCKAARHGRRQPRMSAKQLRTSASSSA